MHAEFHFSQCPGPESADVWQSCSTVGGVSKIEFLRGDFDVIMINLSRDQSTVWVVVRYWTANDICNQDGKCVLYGIFEQLKCTRDDSRAATSRQCV